MPGKTGKKLGSNTRTISANGITFAVSDAQANLYIRACTKGGIYVTASEVISARKLQQLGLGSLRDDGELGKGNQDQERWYFSITS